LTLINYFSSRIFHLHAKTRDNSRFGKSCIRSYTLLQFFCLNSLAGRRYSLPYLNQTELDSPEEMQIEGDECGEECGDDGDGSPASTDSSGAEGVTDDDVALDGDSDDQPHCVVADDV